jgi:hypothetical protein
LSTDHIALQIGSKSILLQVSTLLGCCFSFAMDFPSHILSIFIDFYFFSFYVSTFKRGPRFLIAPPHVLINFFVFVDNLLFLSFQFVYFSLLLEFIFADTQEIPELEYGCDGLVEVLCFCSFNIAHMVEN